MERPRPLHFFFMIRILLLTLIMPLVACVGDGQLTSSSSRKLEPLIENARIYKGERFDLLYSIIRNSTSKKAIIYIEGDGRAYVSRRRISSDPTPTNPVGLALSEQDPRTDKIIYVARPCQYTKKINSRNCEKRYWTTERFSPVIIDLYLEFFENLRRDLGVQNIEVIGYSGGGAIAAILAAQSSHVTGLKTVAGYLDHKKINQQTGVSQLIGSEDPMEFARYLEFIPQIHFVGSQDDLIPKSSVDGFYELTNIKRCLGVRVVSAGHSHGWVKQWPILIKEKPCQTPY